MDAPKAEEIKAAFENENNIGYVWYTILGNDSNWKKVHVISYNDNEMYYTTDGFWYSRIKSGEWTFDNSDNISPASERYDDTIRIPFKMLGGRTILAFTSKELFEFYGDAQANYIEMFGATFERQALS
jgi:hypothetical protein